MRARAPVLALAVAVFGAAGPALAQEPMTGAEFEAYTTGKTLLYDFQGETYGGEDYLPGRRVRWSFLDGHCLNGTWYEDAPAICFTYEDAPDEPVCWLFYDRPGGLVAELQGAASPQELYETGEAQKPLFCLGPDVGT
jgi:hypothetical protein